MLPQSLYHLIEAFKHLPGVGPKTAERYVFYLLKRPKNEIAEMIHGLQKLSEDLRLCSICFDFSTDNPCTICRDSSRDSSILCVVAESSDVAAIEHTGEFNGRYHVLGGVIQQVEGIGPDQLRIRELLKRIEQNGIREVILATNPDLEGETTALYLARLLKEKDMVVSRLARGLPTGADIEYADDVTLGSSIVNRKKLS
ncbi:MAG: recombination protein RecR [Candidatus Kerfeldbacteria bacterium]|nr:recombination protein RecR [Candidatus Kerfeldbacteria bacterium]